MFVSRPVSTSRVPIPDSGRLRSQKRSPTFRYSKEAPRWMKALSSLRAELDQIAAWTADVSG